MRLRRRNLTGISGLKAEAAGQGELEPVLFGRTGKTGEEPWRHSRWQQHSFPAETSTMLMRERSAGASGRRSRA